MNIHENIFTDIYLNKKWGENCDVEFFSGSGSTINASQTWVNFVSNFIVSNSISSLVDGGCGDFTVSNRLLSILKSLDIEISYIGYECFKKLVEVNNKNFSEVNIKHLDIHAHTEKMKPADCLLLKEVMQHWENDQLLSFMNKVIELNLYKFIIIDNILYEGSNNWIDCNYNKKQTGRPLNSTLEPLKSFNFQRELVYSKGNKKSEICTLNLC